MVPPQPKKRTLWLWPRGWKNRGRHGSKSSREATSEVGNTRKKGGVNHTSKRNANKPTRAERSTWGHGAGVNSEQKGARDEARPRSASTNLDDGVEGEGVELGLEARGLHHLYQRPRPRVDVPAAHLGLHQDGRRYHVRRDAFSLRVHTHTRTSTHKESGIRNQGVGRSGMFSEGGGGGRENTETARDRFARHTPLGRHESTPPL